MLLMELPKNGENKRSTGKDNQDRGQISGMDMRSPFPIFVVVEYAS
jgi:hypothetical protein